jgi:hypothetical protein
MPAQNFGKPWKFGQTLGKIKKIWADLSNLLRLGKLVWQWLFPIKSSNE